MSQWILCKSWWPPKKGQRGKFSKLWLLGILGSSDHLGPAAPRLMALTTLMSGMFWGMTRAVVQTTMHFQSLDLRMWHGARRSGKSGKSGTLRSPMVTWGGRVVLGGSTFFFVLKASWLTFLAMGKTRISISKRMFFFKDHRTWRLLVSHESCHRPIHHECSHHNIIFRGGFSFFPVQLLKITELGFPAHPQIRIHTGIQLALVQLESIQNLGIFPRWELPQSWENHGLLADDSWLRGWLTLPSSNIIGH
jgi:hypothetical protein